MSNQFTQKAEKMWQAIPEANKKLILSNVWCSHCRQGTAMVNCACTAVQNNLMLEGNCQTCGEKVRRLID